MNKKETQKVRAPVKWLEMATLHQFTIFILKVNYAWTEIESHVAITNQKKVGGKDCYKRNIRKAIWKSKILKNKSKDMDSNFLVMLSSSKA